MDGKRGMKENFIRIYVSYIDPISNLAIETLLSMQPLIADGVKAMTAADHICHITKTLPNYRMTVESIDCLAGDNCPVNLSMVSKNSWRSPFVGLWLAQV